jgi:hypothetical protein
VLGPRDGLSRARRSIDCTPSTPIQPVTNLVLLPQSAHSPLHHKTCQIPRSRYTNVLLGTLQTSSIFAPLYAFIRETFALSISLRRRQTAPKNIEEQLYQKVVSFLSCHSGYQKPTHAGITYLTALQQHNSNPQSCLAENQTFRPSQMAMRNRLHPQAVKCAKDLV